MENSMDPKALDEAYRQAKHQLELEGFVFTEEDENNIKAVLNGKMTRQKLIKQLKKEG